MQAEQCEKCHGEGLLVWKMDKDGCETPRAMTEDDERNIDLQKTKCSWCYGTGMKNKLND